MMMRPQILRQFLRFIGPGYCIAVGYIDPGNWATDLFAGSSFGYQLLSVLLLSNIMALMLQYLCVEVGLVTGLNLAEHCRQRYRPVTNFILWLLCEIAIIACDLAEIIGMAIALKLLFGVTLLQGAVITCLDTLLLFFLMSRGVKLFEAFIIATLTIISGCFVVELMLSQPDVVGIAHGFIPHFGLLYDEKAVILATGIIGATVMPHNLYLHTELVQSRRLEETDVPMKRQKIYAFIDVLIALSFALCINAAILILSASVFHKAKIFDLEDIERAYELLTPLLGAPLAAKLFAIALLFAGLASTMTATLAGQITMEGFLKLQLPMFWRRVVTRGLAMIPVIIVMAFFGERYTGDLMVYSQVLLSMQLPFAVVPLIRIASSRKIMGSHVLSGWKHCLAWVIATIIIALNIILIERTLLG